VQVDPVKPALKPPGTRRLKHKCVKLPLNFAFKFNLRRYIEAVTHAFEEAAEAGGDAGGDASGGVGGNAAAAAVNLLNSVLTRLTEFTATELRGLAASSSSSSAAASTRHRRTNSYNPFGEDDDQQDNSAPVQQQQLEQQQKEVGLVTYWSSRHMTKKVKL